MGRKLISGLAGIFFVTNLMAQDMLPEFSATSYNNGKTIINWHNKYPAVTQISIQRSVDSLKDFTTLLSVPDPTIPENGFVDSKVPHSGMYYRLFIVFEDGKYLFTKSRKGSSETGTNTNSATPPINAKNNNPNPSDLPAPPGPETEPASKVESQRIRFTAESAVKEKPTVSSPRSISKTTAKTVVDKPFFIMVGDSLVSRLPANRIPAFRDSILNKTRDTLVFKRNDTVVVRRFVPKEVYKISTWVFISKDGNVHVALPEAGRRAYIVKFFEENHKPLFELKDVRDYLLIVDKTNFVHAGWFRFELYEDGRLKEKNKLFIPKDF